MRIGTRVSPLALVQAHETRDRLARAFDLPDAAFEVVVIKTTGDRIQDRPLREIGGKGLFTREIEQDLLSGAIDIAVHSMKDMPVLQPKGLVLSTYLPREDVRDALICPTASSLNDLPAGALVGTSSLRRKAQVLLRRPELSVVEFRGNVQTRLKKLNAGVARCTFLAMAGLNRLQMTEIAAMPVAPEEMLPAVAQGAIGIEQRVDDSRCSALLAAIDHRPTGVLLAAERAFCQGWMARAKRRLRVWPHETVGRFFCVEKFCAPTDQSIFMMRNRPRSKMLQRLALKWRLSCASLQDHSFSSCLRIGFMVLVV